MINEKYQDIHERIYQFVVAIVMFLKTIPRNPENIIVMQQITKSATSMGANDQEADGTNSKKDFVAKYAIVRKEGKETYYWLRLIGDTNIPLKPQAQKLMKENMEIVKIVSSIIYNTGK